MFPRNTWISNPACGTSRRRATASAASWPRPRSVEESLKINNELAAIEAQIEQVQGRMRYLAGRAAFSTITIQFDPELPAAPEPTPTPEPVPYVWDPGATFQHASGMAVKVGQVSGGYAHLPGSVAALCGSAADRLDGIQDRDPQAEERPILTTDCTDINTIRTDNGMRLSVQSIKIRVIRGAPDVIILLGKDAQNKP